MHGVKCVAKFLFALITWKSRKEGGKHHNMNNIHTFTAENFSFAIFLSALYITLLAHVKIRKKKPFLLYYFCFQDKKKQFQMQNVVCMLPGQ